MVPLIARDNMDMRMPDRLASNFAVIDPNVEAVWVQLFNKLQANFIYKAPDCLLLAFR